MFDRVISFVGMENFEKLRKAKVMVVGLGGVGGYAVEALVRSGIGNIIIVDYDNIDISNINRQIISNVNNIGSSKALEWFDRIKDINPNCNVTTLNMKLTFDNIDSLFLNDFDYLVDAIDDVPMKQEIIKRCLENNISIISSMGTGNKFDPSKLEITDIRNTSYDPLAKKIRKYIISNNIKGKLPVVYSKEQNGKFSGNIPSMMFVPASAGILCANYIIKCILEK